VLLLTGEDDFNALASMTLRDSVDGPVYRVAAPRDSHGVVSPYTADDVLFGASLTRSAINGRHHNGARILTLPEPGGEHHAVPDGHDLLFVAAG
jgi:hypothetical protein